MSCPDCGAESRPEARFCDRCGVALAGGDERRGLPGPDSYTPRYLAERILKERSALAGERKQVTVLFLDIKSSVELSGGVDAEEWHHILDRFFRIAASGVHRFEGTVNQYTGDGIMALFGAPLAHEDHAQRACFAALHLQEELRRYADDLRRTRGLNVMTRTGLHSGEVVVASIGDDLRMDYTAQGHVVGLAKRMEELAEPGRAFLTRHTAALVEGFFDLRALGDFTLRGVREPVAVYELLGPGALRTRLDASRERGFSRFVGRHEEIARLELALAEARAGRGQVLGLIGDPGVGKSRVFHEFVQRCQAQGTPVYAAHAVSHGRRVPFLPVLELLRGYFGVAEQDDDGEARRKIAGTLVLLNPEFERSLPLLFEFMGVADPQREVARLDADTRRQRLFRLLEKVLGAASREQPAVVLIEDLHWIDGGSEAFLQHLAGSCARMRMLLLTNARPEYGAPWSDAPHYHELRLAPLGAEAAAELLADWLGDDPSVRELAGRILARTAGNPFFLEEVVRALAEDGALEGERAAYRLLRPSEEIRVPDSVHTVLASRIDRLGEAPKQVLQTAAVIGERFSDGVLRRVLDMREADVSAALRRLVEAELVREQSLYPAAEYGFRHPLTHAVAYRSMLFHRRAELHRSVAEAMTELAVTALDDRAALLAHHWEAAGEPVDAARWHRRAAQWVGLSDPAEALRHWRAISSLLNSRSDTQEVRRLQLEAVTEVLNLSWRFGIDEAEAARLFEDGRMLAESLHSPAGVARVLMAYGQLVSWTAASDGRQASDLGREAVRLADQTDDLGLQAAARGQLARAHWRARDYRASLAATDEGLSRAPESNEHLRFRARVLSEMARLPEAQRDLESALEIARGHRDVAERMLTHLCFGIWARFTGDFALERSHAQTALDLAGRTGDVFGRIQSLLALGESYLWEGDFVQARDLLETALTLARERHANLFAEASILGLLADACLGAGDAARALRTAEEAVALAGAPSVQALQALARALLAEGSDESRLRAERALSEAEAFVERSGASSWTPHVRVTRARLLEHQGRSAERDTAVRLAILELESMHASGHVAQVARLLD